MMKVLVVLMLVCSVYTVQAKDLYAALREITASLAETKLEVKYLQAENKEQAAKLDKLEDQLQGKQLAFSASLTTIGGGEIYGPFYGQTPLVFKHVVTNIGNAYSPVTGVFTAPLKGAYHFEWHLQGPSGHSTAAYLVKNSKNIFLAYEKQTSEWASPSQSASLLLEAGDVVSVHLRGGATLYDNIDHYCTFSGHLLFTM